MQEFWEITIYWSTTLFLLRGSPWDYGILWSYTLYAKKLWPLDTIPKLFENMQETGKSPIFKILRAQIMKPSPTELKKWGPTHGLLSICFATLYQDPRSWHSICPIFLYLFISKSMKNRQPLKSLVPKFSKLTETYYGKWPKIETRILPHIQELWVITISITARILQET